MLKTYRTVEQLGQAEIVIEKSTFIGYAKPVSNEEEALAFIQEIKKKHRDATHNVPAYVLGEHNEIQRCNDDGEPSGCGGYPLFRRHQVGHRRFGAGLHQRRENCFRSRQNYHEGIISSYHCYGGLHHAGRFTEPIAFKPI